MKSFAVTLAAFCTSVCSLASGAHAQGHQIVANVLFDMNRPEGSCQQFGPQDIAAAEQNGNKIGTICYFIETGGKFAGGGENGRLFIGPTGSWAFVGSSCQPGVFFRVFCVR